MINNHTLLHVYTLPVTYGTFRLEHTHYVASIAPLAYVTLLMIHYTSAHNPCVYVHMFYM